MEAAHGKKVCMSTTGVKHNTSAPLVVQIGITRHDRPLLSNTVDVCAPMRSEVIFLHRVTAFLSRLFCVSPMDGDAETAENLSLQP